MTKKVPILKKILASFDNSTDGFSARKLSAFAGVNFAMLLSFKLGTPENGSYLVGIWLTFALLCMGIITAEQLLIYFKGEGSTKEEKSDDDTPEQLEGGV